MRKTLLRITSLAALVMWPSMGSAQELVWWTMSWNEANARAFADEFIAENPGVTVRIEPNVAGGLQSRVLIAIQSGNTPDLIDIQNGVNIPLAETGGLAAIGDALASEGVDFEDFLPAAVETATYNGQVYGMPFQVEAHAFLYNKAAYRDAGLDPETPPTTWKEFLEFSEALTGSWSNGSPRYGYGVSGGGPDQPGNSLFRSLPFLWMNGGGILGPDNEVIVNSPASVEGLKLYVDLFTEYGYAPPSTLENDSNALRRLFSVGNVAQIPGATSDVQRVLEADPDFEIGVGLLPHPEGGEPAAILGGWNFVIPEAARNKELAVKLAAFMASPERQAIYTTTFPAAQSGLDLPRFDDPLFAAHKEMLGFARPQPTIPEWSQITRIYYTHLQEALLGSMSAQQSMDAAAAEITALLSN
ncbi:ABC transporter substrate-binding protein [Aureimonas fodinaquatilis]|uniref:ABC transporter substrate-binding protein n=1 Tax=Aureimonas fodinaquatilis TaxID=2565783 RepID=A0A5B0E116_9HYPH|nr:ABC transporter substrate-binding protein [Aureimonas fodinaquatilis]KAA0971992.1 ABC transporter substrate-binding protein [Aureimonas fodinaquatilis]